MTSPLDGIGARRGERRARPIRAAAVPRATSGPHSPPPGCQAETTISSGGALEEAGLGWDEIMTMAKRGARRVVCPALRSDWRSTARSAMVAPLPDRGYALRKAMPALCCRRFSSICIRSRSFVERAQARPVPQLLALLRACGQFLPARERWCGLVIGLARAGTRPGLRRRAPLLTGETPFHLQPIGDYLLPWTDIYAGTGHRTGT